MLPLDHPDVTIKSEQDRIIYGNLLFLAHGTGLYKNVEIARKTGISAQHLGDVQRGTKGFGPKSIDRICEAFGVDEKWVITNHHDGTEHKEGANMDELYRWQRLAESWERYARHLEQQLAAITGSDRFRPNPQFGDTRKK